MKERVSLDSRYAGWRVVQKEGFETDMNSAENGVGKMVIENNGTIVTVYTYQYWYNKYPIGGVITGEPRPTQPTENIEENKDTQ
jgi:hypothetical protein